MKKYLLFILLGVLFVATTQTWAKITPKNGKGEYVFCFINETSYLVSYGTDMYVSYEDPDTGKTINFNGGDMHNPNPNYKYKKVTFKIGSNATKKIHINYIYYPPYWKSHRWAVVKNMDVIFSAGKPNFTNRRCSDRTTKEFFV